jgi:hypothetical protein
MQMPGGHLDDPALLEPRGHGQLDLWWRQPILQGQEA